MTHDLGTHAAQACMPGPHVGLHASAQHGREYYFVSKELFTRDIAEGRFLEHAEVHGRLYGTSAAAVQAVLDEGRVCVLDVSAGTV